jgi:hypothetical protein
MMAGKLAGGAFGSLLVFVSGMVGAIFILLPLYIVTYIRINSSQRKKFFIDSGIVMLPIMLIIYYCTGIYSSSMSYLLAGRYDLFFYQILFVILLSLPWMFWIIAARYTYKELPDYQKKQIVWQSAIAGCVYVFVVYGLLSYVYGLNSVKQLYYDIYAWKMPIWLALPISACFGSAMYIIVRGRYIIWKQNKRGW